MGLPNASYLVNGLTRSVNFDLGGVFANQLLAFLAVVGFVFLLKYKSKMSNFLISWVFVAGVSILFATADFVFDRFLFLMPSAILCGSGLFAIVQFGAIRFGGSKGRRFVFGVAVVGFVFLVLLNGSLRYLSNINIL